MNEEKLSKEQMPEAVEQFLPALDWIAERIPGGFFIYRADEKMELLSINRFALRMFGCETLEQFRELTGFTFRGMVHPEDYEAVQGSIERQIADESNEKKDYTVFRIIRRDGSVRWVDDYGHYAQFPGYGDVYYVFLGDITDQYIAREESKLSAQVISGLSVDFTSIYLLNLDSGAMRPYRLHNKYISEIAEEMTGGNGKKADWRSVLPVYAERYVLPEDRELYLRETSENRMKERLARERSYSVSYRCRGQGDELVYMSMSVVGIDSDGDTRRAVMGYRDVTAETLRVQRELAANLKLEMDLEKEKHANQIKSDFLFNISHDIRTPMNAIVGFSDLAKRHLNDPARLETYLGKVDESSRQLLALIDDLLEMSKLEYGRIELKAEPADLREEIDRVLDLFRAQSEEKKLTLHSQLQLPEGKVLVDAHRFRRVLSNLVSNAVKFTPAGGTVRIGARQKQVSESGYARFEFTVADTGIGMTEDFMKRMYEAFEREETSTRAGTIGTGLGLSITKNLLDIMGGSISVKSRKGAGTTFTVDLPLKLADRDTGAAAAQYEEETAFRADGEHRILLVEDIEINRMLAETILEEAGFLVESVPDGCDAVEAVSKHPLWYYDLILMDIQMPVMNGYEATRSIRALNRADVKTLPIIALSANARDEDKRQSLESGMNHHVAKPFDVAHLISTVNEHIAKSRAENEAVKDAGSVF